MTEYSKMAQGSFTAASTSAIVNLPFVPDYVELWNYTNFAAGAVANKVVHSWFDKNLVVSGNTPTLVEVFSAAPALTTDVIATGGISTFSAGQLLQYGTRIQISGITKANPAVVTTASNHGYASGDVVIFQGLYQSATTGMPQICNIPFTITVTGATTFTIPWNTNQSNYTALSGSPTGAFVKKVLYPFLYAPGETVISAITTGTTTTIDTTCAHNLVVGQEVAFRIPTAWGMTQLNSLPNTTVPGSPVYGYVISVTDYNTFVVNINSSSYTAFNSNQTVASTPGLSFPQVVAVGDVNTGGVQISSGSPLYPSPYIVPIGTTQVSSINGPAVLGSFFNNTAQGFTIGTGTATTLTSAQLLTASDVVVWHAYAHDYNSP